MIDFLAELATMVCRYTDRLLLVILCCALCPLAVSANTVSHGFDRLSDEDMADVREKTRSYHGCVYQAVSREPITVSDVRQFVQRGVDQCRSLLEVLDHALEGYGIGDQLRTGYVGTVRKRAINQALRLAMQRFANE